LSIESSKSNRFRKKSKKTARTRRFGTILGNVMTKFVKVSPLLIGVLALAGFLIYLYLPQEEVAQAARGDSQTPVVVAPVAMEEFPLIIEALGTAVANESVTITAQEADVVKSIYFEDGETVEKGKLLLELNNEEELARSNELNVNIAEAKRQLNRIKGLAKESAASEQLLDEQKARVDALESQQDVIKAQLKELQIFAPFSGTLGIREVSIGSLVRPGETITTLDDLSRVKVDFSVSESHLASLAVGQSVFAKSVAYPGQEFEGKITSIDSRIDPITRSVQIRAQIPNQENLLRPGLLLQINLQKRVLDTLVIPEAALIPEGNSQSVYVINNENKAIKTKVTVGQRRPGLVEIIDGLEAGQQVVVEGTLKMRPNASVKILNDGSAQ
jgi:membrane fusion protein (multidrug efflux system)